jgi:hypothetical protein
MRVKPGTLISLELRRIAELTLLTGILAMPRGTAVRANALLRQPGLWINFPSLAERSPEGWMLFREC